MSAWRKVFLRNGFIWPAFITAWGFVLGDSPKTGWPIGLSETMNQVATGSVVLLVLFVLCGGAMSLFRMIAGKMLAEANRSGRKVHFFSSRWVFSYFLEIDEENGLRP